MADDALWLASNCMSREAERPATTLSGEVHDQLARVNGPEVPMAYPLAAINDEYETRPDPGGIYLLANVQSLAIDPFEVDEHIQLRRARIAEVEHVRTITSYTRSFARCRNP